MHDLIHMYAYMYVYTYRYDCVYVYMHVYVHGYRHVVMHMDRDYGHYHFVFERKIHNSACSQRGVCSQRYAQHRNSA